MYDRATGEIANWQRTSWTVSVGSFAWTARFARDRFQRLKIMGNRRSFGSQCEEATRQDTLANWTPNLHADDLAISIEPNGEFFSRENVSASA